MNIRIAFLTLSLTLSAAIVYPQKQEAIQKGIVKTLGRANKKGMPLSGVDICGFGQQNSTYSKEDGTFSLSLPGKKIGDAYKLSKVYKEKYELIDKDVIGRSYAFSDKVHLTIVMASTKQLQEDKKRLEKSFYDMAQNNYNKELESLETERDKSASTTEEFKKRIAELEESFEQYQHMIKDIAEHYARIDYDSLNAMERECCQCIENGNLERAKSLLTMLVNLEKLEREKEELKRIEQDSIQAAKGLAQARTDSIEQRKMQEKHAEHLYQLYTIALTRFQNDSARFYIEQRALLDTTNVEWQNDAGLFLCDFLAEYEDALSYFRLGLQQSISQYGEVNEWIGNFYNSIGCIYKDLTDYSEALKYFNMALFTIENLYSKRSLEYSYILNSLGNYYIEVGNFSEALKCAQQALEIQESQNGDISDIALSNHTIGGVLFNLRKFPDALEYYYKALNIWEKEFGPNDSRVASSYNCIAGIYDSLGNYSKSLEYRFLSLDIRKKILVDNHPDIAISLLNVGGQYYNLRDYNKALAYQTHALDLFRKTFPEEHRFFAVTYDNIGKTYLKLNKIDTAFVLFKKAENILKKTGVANQDLATSFGLLAGLYLQKKDFKQAIVCYNKSLEININIYGKNHIETAITYNNIGLTFLEQKKYETALKYFNIALNILRDLNEENTVLITTYSNLGKLYFDKKEYDNSFEFLNRALKIQLSILGKEHPDLANTYAYIGKVLHLQKNYKIALEYYFKELEIQEHQPEPNKLDVANTYNRIAVNYGYQANYNEALKYFLKAYTIWEQTLSSDNPRILNVKKNIALMKEKIGINNE